MSGFNVSSGTVSYDIMNQLLAEYNNANSDLSTVMTTTNITQADYANTFNNIDTYNVGGNSMNAVGFSSSYMDGTTDIINSSLARFTIHTNVAQNGHSIGGANKMSFLLVGGGGAGGGRGQSNNSNHNAAGGGGGGGVVARTVAVNDSNANYNIYVGAGGTGGGGTGPGG